MAVTLQSNERDAVYAQITADFTLFGDLEHAMGVGEEEACYRLGRKITDGLRLILDGGLGWQQKTVGPTVLTLPDSELRRILMRMEEQAVNLHESRRPDAEEVQADLDEIAAVRTAAGSVFDQTHP
ncbi:MAG TPA: hypothetical protein VKB23_03765 [Solirubrobacterales bacterium]|nr:hypothetical protein [Solirubrobacterales bacterium]